MMCLENVIISGNVPSYKVQAAPQGARDHGRKAAAQIGAAESEREGG